LWRCIKWVRVCTLLDLTNKHNVVVSFTILPLYRQKLPTVSAGQRSTTDWTTTLRHTGHLTTLYDKPPYWSVISRNSDGPRSSLKMADYCRNMQEPAYMNKAVV
jgi:hypothetical protein